MIAAYEGMLFFPKEFSVLGRKIRQSPKVMFETRTQIGDSTVSRSPKKFSLK